MNEGPMRPQIGMSSVMRMKTMKREATPRYHTKFPQAAKTVATNTEEVNSGARSAHGPSLPRGSLASKKKRSMKENSRSNLESTHASSGAPTLRTEALKLDPRSCAKMARWLSNNVSARDIGFETGKTFDTVEQRWDGAETFQRRQLCEGRTRADMVRITQLGLASAIYAPMAPAERAYKSTGLPTPHTYFRGGGEPRANCNTSVATMKREATPCIT